MESKMKNKKVALFMMPLLTHGGGAEKYFINLAREFSERGIQTDVITMNDVFFRRFFRVANLLVYQKWIKSNETLGRESEKSVREQLGKARWIKASFQNLGKILKNYDVIYSKNELVDLGLLKLKGYKKLPPIIAGVHTPIYFHNPEKLITKLHNFLYLGIFYKWLLHGIKCVHVSNAFTESLIKNKFKLKSKLIYYPFSEENIQILSKENKSEIKVDVLRKNIIFVGRLSEQKGFEFLVDIIKDIGKDRFLSEKIFLNVFGVGNEVRNNKIKTLSEKFKFLNYYGHVENRYIPNILARQDFMISPSKWETLPYNVLEAQAMGLPVVAFNIPGPADIIEDGKTGFLVKNEGEFIERMGGLITGRLIIKKEDCIENIKNKFSPDKIYVELINMFKGNL